MQERVNKWYGDNSQFKNMQVSDLFEKVNVNPLAGCLPAIAQIPGDAIQYNSSKGNMTSHVICMNMAMFQ